MMDDAARKARAITELNILDGIVLDRDALEQAIATVLREAHRQGMMDAAGIARAYKSELPYAPNDLGALKEAIDVRSESVAQAIERAATTEEE